MRKGVALLVPGAAEDSEDCPIGPDPEGKACLPGVAAGRHKPSVAWGSTPSGGDGAAGEN